jgi:hypothetical protein
MSMRENPARTRSHRKPTISGRARVRFAAARRGGGGPISVMRRVESGTGWPMRGMRSPTLVTVTL